MEVELERLQVFFPASLEIQEELLKAGFKVPYDKESGEKLSIPVIASYREGRRIKKGRLLKARDYEGDGEFVKVKSEKASLNVNVNEKGFMRFVVKPLSYHLEDIGFTSVPPTTVGNVG